MKRVSVLMVCLGNICRSPLAEELLRSKVDFSDFHVDSAGTSGAHAGEAPDPRSIDIAKKHDLDISQQSCRKFTVTDFDEFDHIYVMDRMNYKNVMELARNEADKKKVSRILDAAFPGEDLDVPDPYTGGPEGFANVYRMLDHATTVIAKQLKEEQNT